MNNFKLILLLAANLSSLEFLESSPEFMNSRGHIFEELFEAFFLVVESSQGNALTGMEAEHVKTCASIKAPEFVGLGFGLSLLASVCFRGLDGYV